MKSPLKTAETVYVRFNELYGETTEYQKERYNALLKGFKDTFKVDSAYIASSSGRVEVCGNHTDHNGGAVISCAISLDTLAVFLPTDDNVILIKSEGYSDIVIDLKKDDPQKKGTSSALVKGVCEGLKNLGYKVGGFIAKITSNVVGGAGISSSASFEVLIAEILSFLYNDDKVSKEEKAKVSQFAESEYFGKPCGLLDQTAISFGGLNRLDFSDKAKIKVDSIDIDLADYTLVLINTGGSHANLTDEYASIPKEMFSVAKALNKERLIDLTEDEFYNGLPSVIDKVSDRAVLRAIHFYEENKRVNGIYDYLRNGDKEKFLDAIRKSGISSASLLQNCRVEGDKSQPIMKALAISEKYLSGGANRVHGGGFAGTILNIVKNEYLDNFINKLSMYYDKKDIIPLKIRRTGTIVL